MRFLKKKSDLLFHCNILLSIAPVIHYISYIKNNNLMEVNMVEPDCSCLTRLDANRVVFE